MLVKNWMSKNVVTVDADDSMLRATKLLKKFGIRVLPVMSKGGLAGVLTDRDLKRASASDATTLEVHELLYLLSDLKVGDIMTRRLITVPYNYTVEEAAELLLTNKISGMPVLGEAGELVGVITQTDLFRALISLTGLSKRGVQFAVELEDKSGGVNDVVELIREYGGRLASVLTSYDGVPEGWRKVYIRTYGLERDKLSDLKEKIQQLGKLMYIVDLRENLREIYI